MFPTASPNVFLGGLACIMLRELFPRICMNGSGILFSVSSLVTIHLLYCIHPSLVDSAVERSYIRAERAMHESFA